MPPDSGAIDRAVVATLQGDAQLLTLMPNGVYWAVPASGAKQFVTVALMFADDVEGFDGRLIEDRVFEIKCVELSTVTTKNAEAALARVDALLERQPLTVAGFSWMTTIREHYGHETEEDEIDPAIRWMTRYGQYRIVMST